MSNRKSVHILNTSSTLLGFCLVVLTSLKISKYSELTTIDEFTGIASILLISSSIFSFLSIRTERDDLAERYEKLANLLFMIALVLVFVITFLIAFSLFL